MMIRFERNAKLVLLGAAVAVAFGVVPPACAQADPQAQREFDLHAQDLGAALRAVGRASGREIMFPADVVEGKRAPRLKGRYTPDEAIQALLKGSGLTADFREDIVFVRGRFEPAALADRPADAEPTIVVTGSRIRGAPVASPVITLSRGEILDAGQNTLADAIRNIPQNFGGGQNPGVGFNVPSASGINLAGASTLNLRGIGSDATLTLLNGHRLAYNATRQGIDISAIPLAAVERIEIVADGASALYGSDAVAGVANVITRRDYDGFETSARLGASTDGGNEQQQYSAAAGKTWASGGFIVAYDFERDTPILARQRSYADRRSPGLSLFPSLRHHNVFASGHQSITPGLRVEFDGIYNKRWSDRVYALNREGDFRASGAENFSESESFAFAPSLRLDLPRAWRLALSAMYGEDRSIFGANQYNANVISFANRACYCNKASSVEFSADGTLFSLPGGNAKVAFGGGYRSQTFRLVPISGTTQTLNARQHTYSAYGELNLPLISAEQAIPFVRSLNFSGAVRYEDYPGIDRVATPKFGLIYAPSSDFEIKGSWGKSFKAPTLHQQYNSQFATLYTAVSRGGTGYPSTATVIALNGGNRALRPERATTWAITLAAHPRALSGARFEISYFDIKYEDRIVAPITFLTQALSNSIYRDLVNFSPSDADKAAALANVLAVNNNLGRPYDPADVVAIVFNTNLNVSSQSIHGVDVLAAYTADLGSLGSLTFNGSGSYLRSSQKLSDLQPVVALAGTLFNPPHFRARAGLTWAQGALTLTSYVNYTGGVRDIRITPQPHIDSMTTLDLAARYKIDRGPAFFNDIDLVLSLQNLLNDKPDVIRTTSGFETPYDSTNYSPVGRFISVSITKHW